MDVKLLEDLDYLNHIIQTSIPVAGDAMKIRIENLSESEAILMAPIVCNSNDKGTGFAGAIFSVAVLAGWVLSMKQGFDYFKTREIYVAVYESVIRYSAPVREDLRVEAKLQSFTWCRGKLRIRITCTILAPDGTRQVAFKGAYVAYLQNPV